jgi:hypothetical protein
MFIYLHIKFLFIKENKKDTNSSSTFDSFHSIINKNEFRFEIILTINANYGTNEWFRPEYGANVLI